jgi:GNAT superfamily N-acetyltransferase
VSDADLIARARETYEAYLALGNERFDAAGATFVRNRSLPDRYDVNHVAHVTVESPQEIDELLARVEAEFAGYNHRAFYLDSSTPPQFLTRLLVEDGYTSTEAIELVLEGELKASPPPADIHLVQDESQWQALFELNGMWIHTYPPETRAPADQTNESNRIKSPAVRWWLAYVNGVPRAFLNSWEGVGGVGQVEDLFTHPEYRHRGLATALLVHCVADARAHGAGPVLIGAAVDDTPKQMYAAMGWRPLYVVRHAVKRLT